jgi:hypothetical protein
MWMTAQVLKHADPNLGGHAYAAACGVPRSMTHRTYVFNHHLATYYGEPFEAGVAAEFGYLTAALNFR